MKLCFLIKQSPYGSALARDALDMALASAAFDQQVSLVFIHDGVFQLVDNQQSHIIAQKSLEKSLAAMALYGIDDCYACSSSIDNRNIKALSEKLTIKKVDTQTIHQIIADADQVMSF